MKLFQYYKHSLEDQTLYKKEIYHSWTLDMAMTRSRQLRFLHHSKRTLKRKNKEISPRGSAVHTTTYLLLRSPSCLSLFYRFYLPPPLTSFHFHLPSLQDFLFIVLIFFSPSLPFFHIPSSHSSVHPSSLSSSPTY